MDLDLTIYDEHPDYPFQGACSLFEGDASNFLIWIWGISKNFSLPGLRFAVLHSPNETIRIAAQRFVMHHLPNTCTQFIARQFLSDYGNPLSFNGPFFLTIMLVFRLDRQCVYSRKS